MIGVRPAAKRAGFEGLNLPVPNCGDIQFLQHSRR
jgi:hypothetical protein